MRARAEDPAASQICLLSNIILPSCLHPAKAVYTDLHLPSVLCPLPDSSPLPFFFFLCRAAQKQNSVQQKSCCFPSFFHSCTDFICVFVFTQANQSGPLSVMDTFTFMQILSAHTYSAAHLRLRQLPALRLRLTLESCSQAA